MIVCKIGRRGQTTIPKEIRELTGLREGDQVAFVRRGEDIVLKPLRKGLRDLRGSVPVSGPQDFEAIRREVLGKVLANRGGQDAQPPGVEAICGDVAASQAVGGGSEASKSRSSRRRRKR